MDSARTAVRPLTPAPTTGARRDRPARPARAALWRSRRGRTVLAARLRRAALSRRPRPSTKAAGLHMILASSAPGIFGGDLRADVRRRSRRACSADVAVGAAGASGRGRRRRRCAALSRGAGAHLSCEWDPMIPFPDARLDQQIDIDLADEATLFWSDAVMSGREARGERWRFSRLHTNCASCAPVRWNTSSATTLRPVFR